MKKNLCSIAVFTLFAVSSFGCGGGQLVGRWTASNTSGGSTITSTLTLNGDGSMTSTVSGAGNCTGTLSYTGRTWTAAATTITISGTQACSGTFTCTDGSSIQCATVSTTVACEYALGANAMNLTLSNCALAPNSAVTFARAS